MLLTTKENETFFHTHFNALTFPNIYSLVEFNTFKFYEMSYFDKRMNKFKYYLMAVKMTELHKFF